MDILTPADRSIRMGLIRSRHTKPELAVRRLVHAMGFRYRLHGKCLPGKPDLVFTGRRRVIFVNGCFWHRHSCRPACRQPSSNVGYWSAKLARNVARDRANTRRLRLLGWGVLTVWECQVSKPTLSARLVRFLQ
jgi:DNA mismatch endonuclease (patch repair protein)